MEVNIIIIIKHLLQSIVLYNYCAVPHPSLTFIHTNFVTYKILYYSSESLMNTTQPPAPLLHPHSQRHCVTEGNSPFGDIGFGCFDHSDAVYDGTDGDAEAAAGAVGRNMGEVCPGVKGDGLVARVVAGHVALAAVDAHVFVYDGHHLVVWEGG